MKITFLGTGKFSSATRRCSATLLNDQILVDIGYGAITGLWEKNLNTENINTLILTHFHDDHIGDLWWMLSRRGAREEVHPLTIIAPTGFGKYVLGYYRTCIGPAETLQDMAFYNNMKGIKIIEMTEFDSCNVGGVRVSSFPAVHSKKHHCLGYVLDIYGDKIGFSGDTYCNRVLEEQIPSAPVWVINCPIEKNDSDRHMGLIDVQRIATPNMNKKFYITHRGEYHAPTNPNIFLPNDGDEVEVNN
ncbi:MAG: MBL fold metallo-hydrolase [Firmicutes bacterium]|nr:MBL fold metallo-hydrolase [Bacillota bacterium]